MMRVRIADGQTLDVPGELFIPMTISCAEMWEKKAEIQLRNKAEEESGFGAELDPHVAWDREFECKAEENEFVRGIFSSQDELIHLANEHIVIKPQRLCCGVTASFDIAYG
ncbi:uncharacterized protein MONOS_8001 [Monocercomonoides exilis]|uniref:uncharacterized protein n=1 Tax=Monocercomonoides exilis TaxID=2049356 RepID=UPI003559DE69|nr:hypothetical protein MONOS_8001 [Monocercomonoides exilis]|eukprot:MONOS_8001.1-p1 / transcript=MONOS_8001.1 / gene=MONOS_8001 / organism=Monocercomonoides_exilis_PA203 / gene_product=unspecified product / transcript_product=unspecified product / location=Mono_scaffold00290:33660-34059(-) / protein_length=111 / sequence_SO=supercontig / SO=protein_coding / is_pseudo=false